MELPSANGMKEHSRQFLIGFDATVAAIIFGLLLLLLSKCGGGGGSAAGPSPARPSLLADLI